MAEPAIVDHILVAASVLVSPLYGAWAYRRLVRRVRAGEANALAAEYRKAILRYWTWTIGLVTLWLVADRPAAVLGFALPGGVRLLAGAIITALGLAFLYVQWRAVSRTE